MVPSTLTIAFAPLDTILPLREKVIIAGTNRDSPYFPGDDGPDTLHAAVFDGECVVGCATLLLSEWASAPAWQLRGMAVTPERQRSGVGRALLRYLEHTLPEKAPSVGIWCNARETAVPFYTGAGFKIMSERFMIEEVGPHYKLYKPFSDQNTGAPTCSAPRHHGIVCL